MRPYTLITLFFLLLSLRAVAAPLSPVARTEVEALLNQLQTSGCQFSRNGAWYSAADAKTHLLRKLDYLEGKDLAQSTEQFIERGATKSSSSGQPYLVKCASTTVESQQWLMDKLKTLRSKKLSQASNP